MALNIGQINFGVDANTAGLRKAIAQLSKFQKQTDQIARSQSKGAQAVASAMSRQESAIKKAFQQTIQLRNALLKAGAPPEQIAKATQAFKRLTAEMTSGKLSVVQYNRSIDAFAAKMNRSKRSLSSLTEEMRKGKKGTSRLSIVLRDLESSAVLALGPLSGLGSRIRSLSAIFSRSSLNMALWVAGIAGVVIGLIGAAKAAITAGEEFKSLGLRFEAATGSMARGKAEMGFTIGLANKLGLGLSTLTKSYTRFLAASQGTNLEGRKSRVIFEQIARAAAGLKLSGADLEGVMRAIEQIMSKGTVQAEELRGQLGDRLPGAFRIAANAIGKTTQELNRMLKAGEVISEDFLPAFAAAAEASLGKNAAKNVDTLSGRFNVLVNNLKILASNFNDVTHASAAATSIIGVAAAAADAAAGAFGDTAEEMAAAAEATIKLEEAARAAAPPVQVLGKSFAKMNMSVGKITDEITILDSAIDALGRGSDDIKFLQDFFTALPEASKLGADGITKLADEFKIWLGLDIQADAVGAAFGIASLTKRVAELREKVVFLANAPKVLADVNDQLGVMRDKAAALEKGPLAGELFDQVTSKVKAFHDQLLLTNESEAERNKLEAEFIALLTKIKALQDDQKQAATDAKKIASDRVRDINKLSKAVFLAANKMQVLRERTAALAKGPDSLEIFDKVERPILKMAELLFKAGASQEVVNAFTAEYRELLEANLKLTDRFARASQQMADAVVNGLEDIILKGNSVRDMLNQLAKELLRVAIRAVFLDKLKSTLFKIFSGGGFPAPIPSPGGGNGGGVGRGFSHGGSFKLTGSGGSDKVPFFGMGKAGETVSVSRGDQMMGGGGINITQINNFEGGGDPLSMIPLLEESNRKLKAEILDGLDRGAFA